MAGATQPVVQTNARSWPRAQRLGPPSSRLGEASAHWLTLGRLTQAWTTHDTEFVLIGGGVPGIRFFVGHTAALITLLRDPMERYVHGCRWSVEAHRTLYGYPWTRTATPPASNPASPPALATRLLSRYYYDRVLNGVTDSAPLTLHELDEWLKGPGAVETVHYVRVLSRGTLDYDEAERNLEEFDVRRHEWQGRAKALRTRVSCTLCMGLAVCCSFSL